jgi:hypothetical protein
MCEADVSSPGAPGHAQLGAVSYPHRFGSSLNPHFHFHVAVVDGLICRDDDRSDVHLDQTPSFDPADPEPIPEFDFDQARAG